MGSTCWVCMRLLCLLLLCVSLPCPAHGVTINGATYEQTGGNWYMTDAAGESWQIAPNQVRVKFDSGVTATQIDTFATRHNFVELDVPIRNGFRRFEYALEDDPVEVLIDVMMSPIVDDAELNTFVKTFGPANDNYYGHQWNLFKMDLGRAWDVTTGSSPITIAIVDQGILLEHNDLNDTAWVNPNDPIDGDDDDYDTACFGAPLVDDYFGWDFDTGTNDPRPHAGPHGTAVAGVVAATRGNSIGLAGVAGGASGGHPIKWVSVKANTDFAVIEALDYLLCKEFDVINFSVGFTGKPALTTRLDSLGNAGTLMFAASGNGIPGYDCGVAFPARHPDVIAVGATDDDDVRRGYSCDGVGFSSAGEIELMAPSEEIITTDNYAVGQYWIGYNDEDPCDFPCDYFDAFGGTSASSPEAAGVGALLLSYNPALSAEAVRHKMWNAAKDLGEPGRDDRYGYGRIDAYKTMTEWGTIPSDTTWGQPGSAMTVYVSGDLTVASGATLTILPGTTVKVADNDNEHSGADDDKVEINVEGELVADGTQAEPITFESWTEDSNEDWVGFYFDNDSDGALFDYCVIRHAEYGIETYVDLTVKNARFENCRFVGIAALDGAVLVHGCVMTDPAPTWGIFLTTADATVRNTVIDNATSAAIHVQSTATLALRGSILRNSDKGVYAGTSYVSVDSSCVLGYNNIGIYCFGTSPDVFRSSIDHNTVDGVMCDNAGSPSVQYCTVTNNYVGVYCVGTTASPVLRRNIFSGNTGGIMADVGANPDIGNGTNGNNTFNSTNSYFVSNVNSWTVMAEGNYWANMTSPCLPNPSKLIGPIDTSPALCSNPNPVVPGPDPRPEPVAPTAVGIVSTSPNPFNPTVVITFGVPKGGAHVQLKVYDIKGKLVRDLVDGHRDGGLHDIVWDSTNGQGNPVASSVYFLRMAAGDLVDTRKLVLLK